MRIKFEFKTNYFILIIQETSKNPIRTSDDFFLIPKIDILEGFNEEI